MRRKAMHITFEIDGPATQRELHKQAEHIVKHIMDNGLVTDTLSEEAAFGAVMICTTSASIPQTVYLFCSKCGSQTTEFMPSEIQWKDIKALPFWLMSFEKGECSWCREETEEEGEVTPGL